MLKIAGISSLDEHSVLILTGSGTAANEAVLTSGVAPEETVIVLSNGEFGTRLANISNIYNKTEVLEQQWGEAYDLIRLEEVLAAASSPCLVAMVHHETSTGLLNPIDAVSKLCKRYGAKLFVDAISSFAADKIAFENSGITFMTTSSGKAIASYPGLSFVFGRNNSFAELGTYTVRNHYLHLPRFFYNSTEFHETPNTPAVSLIATLHHCIEEICKEGMEFRHARLESLANHMRKGLEERNLYQQADKCQSVVLTNARLPESITFETLQAELKRYGFIIYNTKGPFQGKFFQVSTIGEISHKEIDRFFSAYDTIYDSW